MRIGYYFLFTVAILMLPCLQTGTCAQSTTVIAPDNSPPPAIAPGNWTLDVLKSDEFNGTALDSSKWWPIDPCNDTGGVHHGYNWGAGQFFRPQNVSVNNGDLIFKVEYNPDSLNDSTPCIQPHPYPFFSGGVVSITSNGGILGPVGKYSFGYYEMRAKLPGYYDSLNHPVGYGFWPTFWLYYQHAEGPCIDKHDEVDVIDNGPVDYYDAEMIQSHWSDENNCVIQNMGGDSVRSANPFFTGYHKYAVAIFPDIITFYFDDQPYFSADTFSSPGIAHSLNMFPYLTVVMNVQMGGYAWAPYPLPDAPFPQYMYVDYFRYYRPNENNTLLQGYPNPAKDLFNIDFIVADTTLPASIDIYDMPGKTIRSYTVTGKGKSNITLDGSDLAPGVYLYSLIIGDKRVDTKKMIIVH